MPVEVSHDCGAIVEALPHRGLLNSNLGLAIEGIIRGLTRHMQTCTWTAHEMALHTYFNFVADARRHHNLPTRTDVSYQLESLCARWTAFHAPNEV